MGSERKRAAIRKAEQAVESAKLETGGERFNNALLKAELFAAKQHIAELTEQRDELREALEKIGGFTLSQFTEPYDMALACVETAQEAIAKAEKK